MSGAFEAIDADDVDSVPNSRNGVPHRSAFVDDLDSGLLEPGQMVSRSPARSLDDLDSRGDNCLAVIVIGDRIDRGEQRQIDAKRLVGQRLGLLDFGQQLGSGREHMCGDETQCTGVGNRRNQLAITNAGHSAHHDRGFHAKHFSDAGLHRRILFRYNGCLRAS